MYVRARQRAFTVQNIKSGFKATGLWPLSPITVLETLNLLPSTTPLPPCTPTNPTPYNLSLLDSSPPDGTELRQANVLLKLALQEQDTAPSPIKRYTERVTRAYEIASTELTTIRRELSAQRELLQARKKRQKGTRLTLKDSLYIAHRKHSRLHSKWKRKLLEERRKSDVKRKIYLGQLTTTRKIHERARIATLRAAVLL